MRKKVILPLIALCSATFTMNAEPAAASVSGYLLVANKGDRNVSIINPVSGLQVAAVEEGGVTGHELTASPDGKMAYVPIYGDSGVGKPGTNGKNMVVIDLTKHAVVGNLDFGKGLRPHFPVFGPRDGLLYVTTELENSISIIDPKTLKIVGTVPTGKPESHMLAISPDGLRGYTANVESGTVSVLDLKNRKVLAIIPISANTQRISVSTDGGMAFTSDQTQPRLAVIDTGTNQVKKWVPLPASGYGTAATTDGHWLVVAMPKANKVAVVDLGSLKVAHVIDVPAAPQEVLIRPDNQVAYVSCDKSGKVVAISTSDWKVQKMINAGKDADGLAWAAAH